MNQTTIQSTLSTDISKYSAELLLVLIVIVVLLTLVIIGQRRHITDLTTPRYGFLGKPLLAMMLIAFTFGGFGFFYVQTNNTNTIPVSNANTEVTLQINSIKLNSIDNSYQFNLVPQVNGVIWGGDNTYSFDVYWTISNKAISSTNIETNLSLSNKGGIKKILYPGTNTIKATVFTMGKSYTKIIIINI